jgi:hypothetical protein
VRLPLRRGRVGRHRPHPAARAEARQCGAGTD